MASFADLVDDMDATLMESLNDGRVDHLSASGDPLVEGLQAIVDQNVERINEVTGFVDRVTTIGVLKAELSTLARQGRFRSHAAAPVAALGGKAWHISDVAADDGQWITFYVEP